MHLTLYLSFFPKWPRTRPTFLHPLRLRAGKARGGLEGSCLGGQR